MNRDPQGRFAPIDRFSTLRRYWNDPAYRAEVDADYERRSRENNERMDRAIARSRGEA